MGLFNNDNELRDPLTGKLPVTPEREAWGTGIVVFGLLCLAGGVGLTIYLFSGGNM